MCVKWNLKKLPFLTDAYYLTFVKHTARFFGTLKISFHIFGDFIMNTNARNNISW